MSRYLVKGWKVIVSAAKRSVVDNGAVIVNGDSIEEVGTYEDLENKGPFDMELGSEEFIVMPGLINAHYHAMNSIRTGLRDGPLERWIIAVRNSRNLLSSEEVYENAQYYACEMVKAGITCCIDNTPVIHSMPEYGTEAFVRAYSDLGLRAAIAPMVMDQCIYVYASDEEFLSSLPPALAETVRASFLDGSITGDDDYIEMMRSIFSKYDRTAGGTIRVLLSPTGVQWCSDPLLLKIKNAAVEWGAGIQMHLLETRYQMQYALRTHGSTAVDHLSNLGFLGREVSCAHSVWMTETDIQKFADSGASVVHNPGSNLRLGSGIAPILKMLSAGVRVAVGTDGTSIGAANDLFSDLRVGDLLQRQPGMHSPRIDAWTWLECATVRGAEAAQFGDECGTLEAGKKADIVLLNKERIFRPYLNAELSIADAILNFAMGSDVDTVLVNGRIIVKGRHILTVDESALAEKVRSTYERAQSRAGTELPVIRELEKYVADFYIDWDKQPIEIGYQYNTR